MPEIVATATYTHPSLVDGVDNDVATAVLAPLIDLSPGLAGDRGERTVTVVCRVTNASLVGLTPRVAAVDLARIDAAVRAVASDWELIRCTAQTGGDYDRFHLNPEVRPQHRTWPTCPLTILDDGRAYRCSLYAGHIGGCLPDREPF